MTEELENCPRCDKPVGRCDINTHTVYLRKTGIQGYRFSHVRTTETPYIKDTVAPILKGPHFVEGTNHQQELVVTVAKILYNSRS